MNAKQRITTTAGANDTSGGYSMVEMLVAVGMAAIIGMGLYAVFNSQQRASRSQKSYNQLQTTCTFAMDMIKNDLLLAGFEARKNSEMPISDAGANTVTFEFFDEKASTDPPFDDVTQYFNDTQITYSLDGDKLVKTVGRWHDPTGDYTTPVQPLVLADGIQTLSFKYLDKDNTTLDPAVTPITTDAVRKSIRAVKVSLVCVSKQKDAIYANPDLAAVDPDRLYQKIALTAEIRPRNIAVSENIEDKTPPAVPLTNNGPDGAAPFVKVWDEGTCGCLNVTFTSNTDSDIAGYTVYYGLATGSYLGRTRLVHQAGPTQTTTLRNLTATDIPYFIAIAAYDKSGNQSELSTEVTADPDTSIRVEAGTASDTTINPIGPPAPGAPTIATPADNQLLVSWTGTYSDCLTSPTHGYRIYRSTNPSFTPQGASAGLGNCIADESTLGHDASSYLDTGADTAQGYLVGCAEYFYKIAVVNCDPSQLTNYTDPGAGTTTTYTAASFATISGTPTDGSRTSNPTLSSAPGYRRIILSVTNPSRAIGQSPDFVDTRVYFSTVDFPVLTADRITVPGPDEGYCVVNDPGGGPAREVPDHGSFETAGGGPHAFNFDSEISETPAGGLGAPELSRDETYYFLALSYDLCKNVSQDTDQAQSSAELCVDCDAGQPVCHGPPPVATNLRVTEGCDGSPLRIDWDYDSNNYTTNPDFQGFRVVRCQVENCEPNDPVLLLPLGNPDATIMGDPTYLFADKWLVDDSVVDGEFYSYRVYAADCSYQAWLEAPIGAPPDNAAGTSLNVTNLTLGYFDRAHIDGDQETTLTADIGAWDQTIPVDSTAGWTHRMIQINSEVIQCDNQTPTAFTECWWRGAEATIPIAHVAGTPVRSFPPAPAVAATTGDLSLVPPTFLHNTVKVGARNTSVGGITLNQLTIGWLNPAAWFSDLLYNDSFTAFHDGVVPLTHGAAGSSIVLSPVVVDPAADNVPMMLTFLKSDGTVDTSVDLREEELDLTWTYRNNSTGIDTCSREWIPPNPAGIVAPVGPIVGGTSQSAPNFGTVAWPVPGSSGNALDAVIAPADSWNQIYTNVHDTSGAGIASVRLYYTSTDRAVTTAPAVTGAYPDLAPYTMVSMSSWGWSDIWSAQIPKPPQDPGDFNDSNVWYFIVAVDNEGNFDREPEAGQGAFQYYQQPEDPCLTTPRAPWVMLSSDATSVTLDWRSEWWPWINPTPNYYFNEMGMTPARDLAGFRVYHQIGTGGFNELTSPPPNDIPPTEADSIYTHDFGVPASSTLTSELAEMTADVTPLNVADSSVFRIPGKVKIDDEIFKCASRVDASQLNGCARAQDGTVAAYHASGAFVTQDLLALNVNSFFVRAYDTCPSERGGPNYNDSEIVSVGSCQPVCQISAPIWGSIPPGETLSLGVTACQLGLPDNNIANETVYLHVCSTVEGDDVRLTENGDLGWFTRDLPTALYEGALVGGNDQLMVNANDTVTIGGFSMTANSWADINSCTDDFTCGPAKVVTIATPPPDPCAGDHTPLAPSAVTSATSESCNSTKSLTLTWNPVTPPPECDTFRYQAYYCTGAGCTPTEFSPVGGFSYACAGATCTSNPFAMGGVLKNDAYRFSVAAECVIDGCAFPPDSRTWLRFSTPVTSDPCP